MDYSEMYSEMEKMMEEMMQDPLYQKVFWISFIAASVVALLIGLVMYILGAVGLRRLSATAGFAHPVLAFIPILRWMMLGKLAELHLPREKASRKVFAYSVHLPILMTLSFLLETVYSAFIVYYDYLNPDLVPPDQLLGLINGVSIAYSVIDLIATVILLLALHRIFTLLGCSATMLFTILCGLVSYCLPIMLLVFRNRCIAPQPVPGQDPSDDDESGFYYDNK